MELSRRLALWVCGFLCTITLDGLFTRDVLCRTEVYVWDRSRVMQCNAVTAAFLFLFPHCLGEGGSFVFVVYITDIHFVRSLRTHG